MKLDPGLIEATFVVRLNRFAALVRLAGHETVVHVANSGRLRELFQEGNRVLLSPVTGRPGRRTRYDLTLVDLGHTLVSTDARLPNALVHEALRSGQLSEFSGYQEVLKEQTLGGCRLDLLLLDGERRCYVEVKSVTLVMERVALFPDAPTARGERHVRTLAQAVQQGWQGAVVFVVQRGDASAFAPNDSADPAFGRALRWAHGAGVGTYAYRCQVSHEEVTLAGRLPVLLNGPHASRIPGAPDRR